MAIPKLDKETIPTLKLGYIMGTLVALIEAVNPEANDLYGQLVVDARKFDFRLTEALKKIAEAPQRSDEASEFVELAQRYHELIDQDKPWTQMPPEISNTYHIGYFHQKARLDARRARRRAGKQIKEARKAQGKSLEDMETLTGINRNVLSRIEAGRQNATIDTYSALGAVLGLTFNFD